MLWQGEGLRRSPQLDTAFLLRDFVTTKSTARRRAMHTHFASQQYWGGTLQLVLLEAICTLVYTLYSYTAQYISKRPEKSDSL